MADIFDLFKKIEKPSTSKSEPITHIIAGLGNPGDKYLKTRHNAGFLTVDYAAQRLNVKVDRSKYKALIGEAVVGGKRVLLMKPQTFMNLSGEAVVEAMNFYKIPIENVIVICDDVNLAPGKLRIRKKGSDGGQKGLRSIITLTGSDNFPRIRMGVGAKPHPDYDLADWVLGEFAKEDAEAFFGAMEKAYDALALMVNGEVDKAMNSFN